MSRSIAVKFVAFLLAALTLTASVGAFLSIGVLSYFGLYDTDFDSFQQSALEDRYDYEAGLFAMVYDSATLGNCPQSVLEAMAGNSLSALDGTKGAVLVQGEKELSRVGVIEADWLQFSYTLNSTYYSVTAPEGAEGPDQMMAVEENGEWVEYPIYLGEGPEYTVTVYVKPSSVDTTLWKTVEWLWNYRYRLIFWGAFSVLTFAVCAVTLCYGAARTPGSSEIRPGGLNRVPLDLYALVSGGVSMAVVFVGLQLAEWTFSDDLSYGGMLILGILALCLSVVILAFCYAFVAQVKTRRGFWWRNSLFGRCLLLVKRGVTWLVRGCGELLSLLPVMWQWLLTAGIMALALTITFALSVGRYSYFRGNGFWLLIFVMTGLACIGVVCYGGYAFGTLLSGVRQMNRGNLDHKIPTKYLVGSFKDFAVALNALSESAMVAAQNQLKSERMKTELITNVSHDIKTPLTSLINYVDLLQKPHTQEEERLYLDVLARQSQRLKKLIEDLMEMSKASTGNMTVDITRLDAVEAVNQALGEFSGKLASARLIPVFSAPEEPVMMLADGRLVWRVLSNLLGNVVKYALPGTRVYIDVAKAGGHVLISVKNISSEQLGVSAEELMERFVRGDTSRNTEGSGLGLNIAKSLMEVQKGQLSLLVDGDLFKVTLLFPGAP